MLHYSLGSCISLPQLITEEWSVQIEKETGKPLQLFNIGDDPDEDNDLIDTHPDIAEKMSEEWALLAARDKRLHDDFKAAVDGKDGTFEMDEETVKKLKALGYL